ncbi:TPA: uracil-DNA glycosylase family protein [Pseudomonas aeruginosa]
MPTLDAFLTDVRACTRCAPHLPHGVQPVFQFHPSAPILIAGQAPGARVHASGVPFDDASGARLRAWLGVDRDTFYDPTRIAILPMGFKPQFPGKEVLSMDIRHQRLSSGMSELKSCPWLFFFPLGG